MKKILMSFALMIVLCLSSCSSFIAKEQEPSLMGLEENTYVLLRDVEINKKILHKNDTVKILIIAGDDWIKVYAYSLKGERLKASRFLILYIFSEEFPGEKFDFEVFNKRLSEVLKPKS